MTDPFAARSTLRVGGGEHEIFRLDALQDRFDVERLPYTLKILLENALRTGDERDVEAVAGWDAHADPSQEIAFTPARVLLQDFTGVPAIVDLAAMRDAMRDLGGDAEKINPLLPAELVIDHSVQVDEYATRVAMRHNTELEFERNSERYAFLRWGQTAFRNFKVVPPNTGIVHQVNLEYLARVVETRDGQAFPDTLVGTDSHTTMINGLGVLGWGVGGIEAEAAMLGQPVSMLVPQVVGFKLKGKLPEGATATDLVLTVTEMLRRDRRRREVRRVLRRRADDAAARRPRDDREHVARVRRDVRLLPGRRVDARVPAADRPQRGAHRARRGVLQGEPALARPGARADVHGDRRARPGTVEPVIAGPRRPQDRVALSDAKNSFLGALASFGIPYGDAHDEQVAETFPASDPTAEQHPAHDGIDETEAPVDVPESVVAERAKPVPVTMNGDRFDLEHGAVVIAAITSCTNTSNPQVMIGAGLLAKKAVEKGPDAQAVGEVEPRAGLEGRHGVLRARRPDAVPRAARLPHRRLRLHDVHRQLRPAAGGDLRGSRPTASWSSASVLSGNRNFEARIHPEVKANYLASPPLVVAYALAGRMDIDLDERAARAGPERRGRLPARHLADLGGDPGRRSPRRCTARCSAARTADVFAGDEQLALARRRREGELFAWDDASTYVRRPPYFDGMTTRAAVASRTSPARAAS